MLAAYPQLRTQAAGQTPVDAFAEQQVVARGIVFQTPVNLCVVDGHDRIVDGDRVGHPDRLFEEPDQAAGNKGLAGTGRPVEHQRPVGIERDSEPIEHVVAQHHVTHRLADGLAVDARGVHRLQPQQRSIGVHGKGRRAQVAAALQGIARGLAASLGKPVAQRLTLSLAQHFNASVLAQPVEHLVQHYPWQA